MTQTPGATGSPCRTWGAVASLAWGFAAIAAWLAAQIAFGEVIGGWFEMEGAQLAGYAPFVAIVTITSAVVPLVVIAAAVRSAGCSAGEYLALQLPAREYFVLGLFVLAVVLPLVDLLSWFAGYPVTPPFVVDLYKTARESGALLLLLIAIVIAAPLIEEVVFRGFLLPGLASSAMGTGGALVLTSGIWALLHAQYQPFYLIQIVVLGVLFGWLRLRSGSTILTIVLHGLLNFAAMVQAAVLVEWMT
jgi:uncharacterized protein